MKNLTRILLLAMMLLLQPSNQLLALEVRQEFYEFQKIMARLAPSITYVLTGTQVMKRKPTTIYTPIRVFFEKESSALSPLMAGELLTYLQQRGISQDIQLVVSGYACDLGSEQFNLLLSMQRAVAVSSFLTHQGFKIGAMQAKGETEPITKSPEEIFKNRRVEIRPQEQTRNRRNWQDNTLSYQEENR